MQFERILRMFLTQNKKTTEQKHYESTRIVSDASFC